MQEEQEIKNAANLVRSFGEKSDVAPYYLKLRNLASEGQNVDVMNMGTYVNPQLAQHSDYFGALEGMMKCVERNAHVKDEQTQETVCKQEFKALRMQAFKQNLLYHALNKRFVMYEVNHKRNMSGY